MAFPARTAVLLAALCAAGAGAWYVNDGPNGWRSIDARWQLVREKEVRNAGLRKEVADLREKNRRLKESQEEMDQMIREHLHKAKPGEVFFKLPEPAPPAPQPPSNSVTPR
jgi:cell division protein FtsB